MLREELLAHLTDIEIFIRKCAAAAR